MTTLIIRRMKNQFKLTATGKALFVILVSNIAYLSFAQNTDSLKAPVHFGGAVTLTTKGISIIPNLTLGKPAAIFDLSMGRRLSFEPQFRFALEGKPWSFLFWFRYDIVNNNKFLFKIGAHPAIAFKTIPYETGGSTREILRAQRYLAGEVAPTYFLTKGISTGLYFLYSRGLEEDIIRNTNYLAFRINFSNIKVTDKIYMRFNPQIYYLNMDRDDGFYFNATLTLAARNFPLSVTSLINKTIQTDIPFGDDFLWNVSLVYSFNKNYAAIKTRPL
jgi:hypothetical protein